MNNLYRELAPVSGAAWASIEAEARRTFEQHVAARRVVDVRGPAGLPSAPATSPSSTRPPARPAGSSPGSARRTSSSSSGSRSR
jgi:hypothetical protein